MSIMSNYKYHDEQDESSDIEQQPPLGDRKYMEYKSSKWGGGGKTNGNII